MQTGCGHDSDRHQGPAPAEHQEWNHTPCAWQASLGTTALSCSGNSERKTERLRLQESSPTGPGKTCQGGVVLEGFPEEAAFRPGLEEQGTWGRAGSPGEQSS